MKNTPPELHSFSRTLHMVKPGATNAAPHIVVASSFDDCLDKWLNSWYPAKPISIQLLAPGLSIAIGADMSYTALFQRDDITPQVDTTPTPQLDPSEVVFADQFPPSTTRIGTPLSLDRQTVCDFFKLKQSSKREIAVELGLIDHDDRPNISNLEQGKLWVRRVTERGVIARFKKEVTRHLANQEKNT